MSAQRLNRFEGAHGADVGQTHSFCCSTCWLDGEEADGPWDGTGGDVKAGRELLCLILSTSMLLL